MGELLSVTEVMVRLGLSRSTVVRSLQRGKLKGELVGNSWVVYPESVEAFARQSRPRSDGDPYTANEAAAELGISGPLVHHHLKSGKLKGEKTPEGWRIAAEEVKRFAAEPRKIGRPPIQFAAATKAAKAAARKPGRGKESPSARAALRAGSRMGVRTTPAESEEGEPATTPQTSAGDDDQPRVMQLGDAEAPPVQPAPPAPRVPVPYQNHDSGVAFPPGFDPSRPIVPKRNPLEGITFEVRRPFVVGGGSEGDELSGVMQDGGGNEAEPPAAPAAGKRAAKKGKKRGGGEG